MLSRHEAYRELGANYFDERRRHSIVDRLARRHLIERRPGEDRREVVVRLRPPGETLLRRLAGYSIAELTTEGPRLVASLRRLLAQSTRRGTSSTRGRRKPR